LGNGIYYFPCTYIGLHFTLLHLLSLYFLAGAGHRAWINF